VGHLVPVTGSSPDNGAEPAQAGHLRAAFGPRSPGQISSFFAGLELVQPGVVGLSHWRPDATPFPDLGEVPGMGGVGRKP